MNLNILPKICAPSIALMNKLKYPAKLGLLSLLVLAMCASIIGFLLNNLQSQADFSIQENVGVEYINPLKNLLFDLQKYRDSHSPVIASKIKEDIQAVDSIDKKYNKKLSVESKWSDVKATIAKNDINAAIPQTFALIDYVTLKSNLILDPDIDTYYLMDTFCVRTSSIAEKIYTLKVIGGNKILKKPYVGYDLIRYVTLLDELNEMLKTNLTMITNYNPSTKEVLDAPLNDAYKANKYFITLVNKVIEGEKVDARTYFAAADKAVSLTKTMDEVFSKELYKLTNIRIHKYSDQEPVSVIITIVSLIIIGYLFAGFYLSLVQSVNEVSSELFSIAGEIESASYELSSSGQRLAEGNTEQASAIQETASTLEESSSMVNQNNDNTRTAATLAKQAKESASKGAKDMAEMMSSMDELKTSSNEIAKIIKVIDEIAFQTNILSLNAAVEAARAGDVGKGFAVVAEEVRNLAQRCASAAKDTTVIIDGNIALSEKGVKAAAQTSEALNEINEQVQRVSEIIDEVAVATEEQNQGIGQINKAMSQMSIVTQNNASIAEGNVSAIDELTGQAQKMKTVVSSLISLINSTD